MSPRAALDAFARAAEGGEPYIISNEETIHCAAVTEGIIKSADSGQTESV